MSGRYAMEMKIINNILTEMKKKSLPDVIYQYDLLPSEEKKQQHFLKISMSSNVLFIRCCNNLQQKLVMF